MMRRATTRKHIETRPEPIIRPERNCWRVERAHKFYCVQDAADYFRRVRRALLDARDTVFVVGWDFASTIDLDPGADDSEAPTRLDALLAFVTKRRPSLRCSILTWDYGSVYTLEREPLTRWRLRWHAPRHVRLGFDDHHPVGASHHQKVIVVDDQLAFCGSIDLTSHRWDETAHRVEEPARKTVLGLAYGPYHELQAMMTGPVAAAFGELARDRWRALGYDKLPPIKPSDTDLWPRDLTPDITDVDVAIVRTVPPSETRPGIRECETLFRDSIALAQRTLYIENQYVTDEALSEALAARLQEPHGPEVVMVVPKECHGWLERQSMGAFRDVIFDRLRNADRHDRLRLMYPVASREKDLPTFIHSKAMIVDDELLRIGSANFARRSMGMDTEADVAVEAGGDPDVRAGIRRVRDRLLAEHLGIDAAEVCAALERNPSLCALIDSRQHADRTLVPVERVTEQATASETLRATLDPDEPIGFGATVQQLVPPVDATGHASPLRLWILPAIAILAAILSSSVVSARPELRSIRDALADTATLHPAIWIGTGAFVAGGLLLVPIELLTIASAVAFGAGRGALIATIASLSLAVIGYIAGRTIGAAGAARWISARSYRSVRQLGAHGIVGVIVLRLSSVAGTGAIHLLCGAGRVPVAAYLAGTMIGVTPAIIALSALGGLLRDLLLHPSIAKGLITIGGAVLILIIASVVRTLLLIRQFAPSVAGHRQGAEFG
jgi:phospholipase D1/2